MRALDLGFRTGEQAERPALGSMPGCLGGSSTFGFMFFGCLLITMLFWIISTYKFTGDALELLLPPLIAIGSVVGFLAWATHALRKSQNPRHWERMTWFFVLVGIFLRPLLAFVLRSFFRSTGPSDIQPTAACIAAAVAILVLPVLMRWLNKVKPEPGLAHVAVPFSFGLFLDAALLAAYRNGVGEPF